MVCRRVIWDARVDHGPPTAEVPGGKLEGNGSIMGIERDDCFAPEAIVQIPPGKVQRNRRCTCIAPLLHRLLTAARVEPRQDHAVAEAIPMN